MKIHWEAKNLYWQLATLTFFIMLWATPVHIHLLLIIGYIFLGMFEYSMAKGIYIDTIIWYGVIIAINIYWLYKDYTIGHPTPTCKISHPIKNKDKQNKPINQ